MPGYAGTAARSRRSGVSAPGNLQGLENPADGRCADPVAELEQLALDPLVCPAAVLGGELLDQHDDLGADRRPSCLVRVGPLPGNQAMPLLDLLNYRRVECEDLDCHPAGRSADLACRAHGVLRGRALEEPVGLPQVPDAVVELAADLRGHRRHELPDLHGCLCGLTDDAASHVLEDLDEGDGRRWMGSCLTCRTRGLTGPRSAGRWTAEPRRSR